MPKMLNLGGQNARNLILYEILYNTKFNKVPKFLILEGQNARNLILYEI